MITTDVLKITATLQLQSLTIGNFPAGGNIGQAAKTVDVSILLEINQTTPGQTIIIPNPTQGGAKIVIIHNVGSASFTLLGKTINPAAFAFLIWNGSTWSIHA